MKNSSNSFLKNSPKKREKINRCLQIDAIHLTVPLMLHRSNVL
nr:MAG TPA: hypothetical protein [Caudoviricetes sp.]